MLILSRKVGERIVINENIVVQIQQINGGQVRLAISAPAGVAIDREEIHQLKLAGVPPKAVANA